MRHILAAGGIVWRTSDSGIDIVVVHRPRRRDWTLPKGKLDPGELTVTAACREVWEETAIQVAPQNHLAQVRYPMQTSEGTAEKIVDYWAMRVLIEGKFKPNDEIDDIRWMPVKKARSLLIYRRDIELVKAFQAATPITSVVTMVPIGHSPHRSPRLLSDALALFAPERISLLTKKLDHAALEALARRQGLPLERHKTPHEPFDDALELIRHNAAKHASSTIGAERSTVRELIAELAELDGVNVMTAIAKPAMWVLGFNGDDLVTVDAIGANGTPG